MKNFLRRSTYRQTRKWSKLNYLNHLLIYCSIIYFSVQTDALGQHNVAYSIYPIPDGYVAKITDLQGVVTYSSSINQMVGAYNGLQINRKAFQFNLSQIPSTATFVSAVFNFRTLSQYGGSCGTLKTPKINGSWTSWTLDILWNSIVDGTSLHDEVAIANHQYNWDLTANWQPLCQDAITNSPHYLGLGLYNSEESLLHGVGIYNDLVSLTVTVQLLTPPVPSNLTYDTKSPGSFVFRWNAPSGKVTGYKVYKNGVYYGITTSVNMLICGLTPFTSYNMSVLSYNDTGDGDRSADIPALTSVGLISGNPTLCSLEPYTLDYIPSGGTITWTAPSNMSLYSAQNSNPAYFQKVSTGYGSITVSVSSACENYTVISPVIHTGTFSSGDYPITGPSSAPCKSYVYYSIPNLPGVTSINWIYPSGMTFIEGQNTTNLTLKTGTSTSGGIIQVKVNNSCGQGGSYANQYTTVFGSCLLSLNISPNPASNEVRISIPESVNTNAIIDTCINSISVSNTYAIEKPSHYRVTVMDKNGVLFSDYTQYSSSFTISTQELKNGNYIIKVTDGINTYTSILIVMH